MGSSKQRDARSHRVSRFHTGERGVRGSGVGMLTRLLALVVIPVVGMAIVSGTLVVRQRTSSRRAERVEREIPAANALVALGEALHNEQASVEIVTTAAGLGLTPRQLTDMLGFRLDDIGARRATTDRAVAALGRSSPFPLAALRAVRTAVDRKALDGVAANARFVSLDTAIDTALHPLMHRLKAEAEGVTGGGVLIDALDAVHAASEALGAGAAQAADVADLALGAASRSTTALVALGHDTAAYDDALQRLDQLHPRELASTLAQLESNPDVRAFGRTVALAQQGHVTRTTGGVAALAQLSKAFGGAFTRDDVLYALVTKATHLVNVQSGNLRRQEESRYRITILYVALLAGATVLAALYLGRSITRPLRRLAAHADTVSNGHLDVEALPTSGPKETRLVSSALNDLVSNLRLLESKSHALANCDFSDPVLAQPLPGRLGQSIQDSVQVLWGSIEERNTLQERLADQATHDSLTGMHNRAAAVSAIDHALARAGRTSEAVGLLYVDLDDFKLANDTHGHEVGDVILREVGSRIGRAVRAGDFVARLGADEFLVVVEQVADVTETITLAQRVIDAVAESIETDTLRFNVGASVGIALALDGDADPLQLLARADLALYRAKQRGHSKIELYDEGLQQQLLERADVERALSDTLARGGDELVLHYQPVIAARTGAVEGVEALVRWNRPGHGMVPPDGFVPIAEASNLVIELDQWVLDTAARQLVAWTQEPGLDQLSVAVNISGRHLLSQQLDQHVRDVLARTGVDPTRLVLEITETVLLHDLLTAAQQLDAVRALGIRVAIDDFGTGYTSLAHLQRLPIDTIKIDRSFVSEIGDRRNRSLVRMVTDLGHQLGVGIVAEGVETPEQLEVLAHLRCDALQGYLISRPVPVADFVSWHAIRVAGAPSEAR